MVNLSDKKVLILGAGSVALPAAKVLDRADIEVFIACRTLDRARRLSDRLNGATPIALDVTNADDLDREVAKVDVVVSLVPYTWHALVIHSAIRNKKNVVTTSYVSPAMLELEEEVKAAGITVMNEIGLDPGIDHLYAVKVIDEVHRAGGKILSFVSYCGGLPAPEASDNPLGYKFSWSPRGVLLALQNSAKYYKDGEIQEVPGHRLMASAQPYLIYPAFAFVAYPNRDSTPYKERYHIPEAHTIIRGSLRYQGFPEFVQVLVDSGFLSQDEHELLVSPDRPVSWKEVLQSLLSTRTSDEGELVSAITAKSHFRDAAEKDRVLAGLRWLGLFSDDKITPGLKTPLDTLCATLEQKMQYEPMERDMAILQHRFEIEHRDGKKETRTSTLLEYGEPDSETVMTTAMGRLVGVPCAVATMFVLDGTISTPGILAPMDPKINNPLMKALKEYGIECTEKTVYKET